MSKTKPDKKDDTCAACGCKIDGTAIQVRFREHVVEVCCEACAERLGEAVRSSEVPE